MVSLEHYLDTSYSPDREFVDGAAVERDVGERLHSRVLANLTHQLHAFPTLRVLTTPTRWRVPDLCVTLSDPREDVLTRPPFLCVEILQRASATDLIEKLDEYVTRGVPHIWVVDPRARPSLTAGDISIPLEEVFFRL